MPLFYTGKGDKGTSSVGKKKIPKDSQVLEALGELDELNSLIGLVRNILPEQGISKKLEQIQENLFIIQARVAWTLFPKFKAPQLSGEKIASMEKEIEKMEALIKPERGFIVPGSNARSGWLDFLRTVSRRTERRVYAFSKKKKLPQEILTYLNRLSSYFYALARLEASFEKQKEHHPTYR
ncbi:MAG: cob(I)yrinic acid a,c-diamide adenosyltransferase [bacterium]|nr:cob(I)yrinic acid a,c-diamide adenosyltransferase [bacterium]